MVGICLCQKWSPNIGQILLLSCLCCKISFAAVILIIRLLNNTMSYENGFVWIFWITEFSVQPSLCCFSINFFKGSVFFGFRLRDISYAWLIVGKWLADGTALIPPSFFNVFWVALLGAIPFSKWLIISLLTLGYTRLVSLGGIKRSPSPK